MANNLDSIILTISDMVLESIKNKTLHQDYTDILDMCRDLNISSYTLHLIIERELVRKETVSKKIDKKDIGFVRFLMPVVTPDNIVFENKDREHTKSADKLSEENKYDGNEDNKVITLTKISHRWGWKTWALFCMMMLLILAISLIIMSNPILKSQFQYTIEKYIP